MGSTDSCICRNDSGEVWAVIKMRKMTPSEEGAKRFGWPRGGRGVVGIDVYQCLLCGVF